MGPRATGRDVPANWPEAIARGRLPQAARLLLDAATIAAAAWRRCRALEDRLAGPLDELWLAVARQERDGRNVVAVARDDDCALACNRPGCALRAS
jgi:hypothetical protein